MVYALVEVAAALDWEVVMAAGQRDGGALND